MAETGPSGKLAARERARLRDRQTRDRLSLPRAQHGDVDINGDLVDELRPSRRALEPDPRPPAPEPRPEPPCPRAARLAACITGVDEHMEQMHLACLLKALERVR